MARVLILRTAGTNCDEETGHAFRLAGAEVEALHVKALLGGGRRLDEFDILALPGGFSYGDDLGAGTVLANQIAQRLGDDLARFVGSGRLVIGICNGFQVLVRLGILPGSPGREGSGRDAKAASLIENVSGKFEDRWIELRVETARSPFLSFAADGPRTLRLPIAHKEGRFVARDDVALAALASGDQIAFTYSVAGELATGDYPANPNGSQGDIAGILDPGGNVLGLMPHPERFLHHWNDPLWTRSQVPDDAFACAGDGFPIFRSAVCAVDGVEYHAAPPVLDR
jgi:phosphoribosylformylglycinamidine synthase